ncbi:MAG: hypothetical protein ABW252_19375 [Polyangiales bacterium]
MDDRCGACRPVDEVCDGKDNDCDHRVDEGRLNRCGSCGEVPEERCGGKDDDCDGIIDEQVRGAPLWYRDCDADGFAPAASESVQACERPAPRDSCHWTNRRPLTVADSDCDDNRPDRRPDLDFGILFDIFDTFTIAEATPFHDLNCDGVAEASPWALALWDDGSLNGPRAPLPPCAQGKCPCLYQPLPIPAGEPIPCWYGAQTLVQLADARGACQPVTERMVITLCR